MKEKDRFFVRIDRKLRQEAPSAALFQRHVAYLQKAARPGSFYGGGFVGAPGGMILFQAEDEEAARALCEGDPLIRSGHYGFELHRWEILIAPPEQ